MKINTYYTNGENQSLLTFKKATSDQNELDSQSRFLTYSSLAPYPSMI